MTDNEKLNLYETESEYCAELESLKTRINEIKYNDLEFDTPSIMYAYSLSFNPRNANSFGLTIANEKVNR